jgi:rhodanese-related sulfurtransferase
MKRNILYILFVLVILLSACSSGSSATTGQGDGGAAADAAGIPVEVEGGKFTRIDPAQLSELLKNKDFFFVNTHIPYEGEIEGTDALIPYNETAQRLDEYPADKNAKIVLYCRSGRMSTITAEELVKAGYTNVWELDRGMAAWERAGYDLIER